MSTLNYGISGAEPDPDVNLLNEPSLQCYKGRVRVSTAGAELELDSDQFDISSGGHHGTFKQRPVKKVYFSRELTGYDPTSVVYGIRIEYDIVTLTTAEQAELYQLGLCC